MKHEISSWDLSEIRPANVKKIFEEIDRRTGQIEQKRPALTDSIPPAAFFSLLQQLEELHIINSKLGVYAHLWSAEDSSNQEANALTSHIETFLTKINNRLLFINLWFKSLPDLKAAQLIKASGKYAYFLERMRKTKPYTLQENEEKIINLKDVSGVSALNSIYGILCSQFQFEVKGKKIGQEELLTYVRDASPAKRELAYRTLLEKYNGHKDVIGEVYKNIINDWREENIHLRRYKTPINVRNIANDIPDQAIDTLLKACEKNQHLFHKFFELKRKRLKLKKMRRFDLYAPIVQKKESKIPYNEAVEMVLDTFKNFSPEFYKEAS
ncbi:MAG: oligoendopeptidase F, partial [Nanoarchaeota archaeon]